MKKKRLLFNYLPWLLVAALCMPLVGCSSDDDDEPESKTFTFGHFKLKGCYSVGFPNSDITCWNNWSKKGENFNVYMVQNGKIYDAGLVHSTDTIITEEEKGTKHLAFEVGFPETVNKGEAIDVIAFNHAETSLSGGNVECKVDLKRGGTMPLLAYSEHSSTAAISESTSLSSIELLYIYNRTSDIITVKHKGFEVKDKWYYTKANVDVTADFKVNPKGISVSDDVVSGSYKAPADSLTKIWSFYVPTGNKIKDARLVLEINGKEVKTQPISSDVSIEFGQFYTMGVQWDGKNLKWVLSNKETRGSKGKELFGNVNIVYCDDNGSGF